MKMKQAPIRWVGGKGRTGSEIIKHIPYGSGYCEPFFGAGSIFWTRRTSKIEVINDLDSSVVCLMRVLQNPKQSKELEAKLKNTLYSRVEYFDAFEILHDKSDEAALMSPITKAWALFVVCSMSFAGKTTTRCWGTSTEKAQAREFRRRLLNFDTWLNRLKTTHIDNDCALNVIKRWDGEDMVFYLDPPYVMRTRKNATERFYNEEQKSLEFHEELTKLILSTKGAVVLSCYDDLVYAPLLNAGWKRLTFETTCDFIGKTKDTGRKGEGALHDQKRTETIFIKPHRLTKKKGLGLS